MRLRAAQERPRCPNLIAAAGGLSQAILSSVNP
ncbi:hypothetical protein PNO31109_02045 [Pandoraea nosoerga]|uniref:Uncharacterized protein n=1 Tax=Pandoraea nosoerga TaxID=2508296 RepID=A0A5E4UHU4_9BURK|nr:hypothetical protein PNO31109_02045 [Pandoraea nosoerga]